MRRETLYLDTSVLNVFRDVRDPFLNQQTRLFWPKLALYDPYISEVVLGEINRAPDDVRDELLDLVEGMRVLHLTEEARVLAQRYIEVGIFAAPRDLNDALHVAVATTAAIDYIVSWNFRHLVKVKTRRLVNHVNQQEGYRTVEIVAPSEL